jgi:flagellar protein FliO/FliZ
MTPVPVDADSVSLARVILAFAVVFGLLACFALGLKYIKAKGIVMPGTAGKRLEIVESLALDLRRRLVIVRCDGDEHLLLLGHDQDIVVSAHLKENQNDGMPKSTR